MVPRIIRPSKNINRTEAINSAPRQGRFRRKWPAPGTSQARKIVPYHPRAGSAAGCTFALVAIVSSVPDLRARSREPQGARVLWVKAMPTRSQLLNPDYYAPVLSNAIRIVLILV